MSDKRASARWNALRSRGAELTGIRSLAVQQLSAALVDRLRSVRGLTVLTITRNADATPEPADATLIVSIDRVGAHTGASREVWMRAAARLETSGATKSFGPYYAIGQASSPKWLIKPGYVWSDSEIAAEAARQAARQITHSLRTGEEALFVRATTVAILPAEVPLRAMKVIEGNDGETTIGADLVRRLADVLFQPSLTPVVERMDMDSVRQAQQKLGIGPADLWTRSGAVDARKAGLIGAELKAEYVFVSRIADMTLEQRPATIQQLNVAREGVEIHAEVDLAGAFIRTVDSAILWSDRVTGSSTARTQFTRHGPRIRRDEQCLADAARVGYAWLRSSFENYKRQYEK